MTDMTASTERSEFHPVRHISLDETLASLCERVESLAPDSIAA